MDWVYAFLEYLQEAYDVTPHPKLLFWLTVIGMMIGSLQTLVSMANGCLDFVLKLRAVRNAPNSGKKKATKKKRAKKR